VFAYGFPIFTDADLKVYQGTTLLTLTTHYTVSGAATSVGGNVTLVTGATSGDIITIYRDLAVARSSDYQTGGDLLAETLNDDLDKIVMMVQQSEADVANRSIRFGQFVTGLPLNEITDNAADRANKVIGFDSTGQPIATTEIGNYQGNWAASTAYVTRDIIKDTSNNNIYIANTSHTSSGSQPITSNTDSGKWDLLVDAASATTSQTAAATSATAAASSASSASTAQTAAETAQTASETAQTAAETAETNAETAETNAETAETNAESAVAAVGAKFTFDNSTSMADPGAGDFRFDNATIASVTAVAFDATSADTGNPDISDFIATWDDSTSTINGHLIFKKSGTPATFAIFTVGAVTDNTGWLQVALTHVDSNGSWTAADGAYVQFVRTGDKGDTGSTGSTGATGARGSDAGLDMVYESTTTDTDQGVGKVWFNHATLSSATVLYMDDVDANSANINTLVDSWDDSSTTALRGTIKVTQKADNAIFAIYNVTGAVTSASTYTKIPVTYITGAGSFTDADTSTVWFTRTGDTGSAGSSTPADDTFRIQDNSDATKQIAFEASGITTGTTRTITVPDSDVTLVSSGAIVNADINASAGIALSKLASDPTYDDSGIQTDIAILGFKVAANGSLAKYNLVDQTIDDFQDASGVNAGSSTNEARDSAGKYYNGTAPVTPTVSGNYDSTAVDGDYTYYKWTTVTSSGSYTTDTAQDYEYLVVAGGGGAGNGIASNSAGGGGGAGGFRTATGFAVAATTIGSITVGAGGATATSGSDSVFSTITSTAGGRGAHNGSAAQTGGSGGGGNGGGGGATATSGAAGNTPSTSPSQGNDGGDGGTASYTGGSGGGGASAVGSNPVGGATHGAAGGAGTASSITGSSVTYAGGGGGGSDTGNGGAGGAGGGGSGAGNSVTGSNGTANTGGGAGGGAVTGATNGGAGGSGIVVIRRPTTATAEGGDMVLVSTTTTAQAAPTKGDIVFTYTNGAGSTVLGTDVTAEYSADGGSTWTAMTLGSEGTTGGHNIATAHDVTLTSTSGTSMAYRIKTLNQSASKTTRIQAVSLGWS
jgi:hypothetical protein